MTAKKAKAKKVVVLKHREGSKRARAHEIIAKSGKAPRQEVLKRIRKLGVKPSTAATWYGSLRKVRYAIAA